MWSTGVNKDLRWPNIPKSPLEKIIKNDDYLYKVIQGNNQLYISSLAVAFVSTI